MPLFWRSWILVILLISVVMSVLILLATLRFGTILSGFVQERLAVLVQSTQASFHAATVLGLAPDSVRNGPAILERALQTDPNISAIHVFDSEGRIVLSTAPDHPAQLAAVAFKAHSSSAHGVWRTETADYLMSGMPILDALDARSLGGLVILYPRIGLETSIKAMGASLALRAAAIAAVIAVLAFGVLRYGLRRLLRIFEEIESAYLTMQRQEWRRAAGAGRQLAQPLQTDASGVDMDELLQLFEVAEKQYAKTGHELAALEPPDRAG